MGAVLHTLNIRLSGEQLTYIANHAEDRVVFVDDVARAGAREDRADVRDGRALRRDGRRRRGLAPERAALRGAARASSPTSSTTRSSTTARRQASATRAARRATPRASSTRTARRSCTRSTVCIADNLGLRSTDRVLPVVPMFHANAWGIPYAAPLTGADLVMPTRFLQGEPLAKLIESEKVTVAGGVPTIWLDLLNYADENKPDLSSLRTVACGGSAVPLSLMQAFEERHGVHIIQAWGMTETSPVASVAHPPKGASERRGVGRTREGRPAAAARRGAARGRRRRGGRVGRRVHRRARGARAVDRALVLQRPVGRRQVRRRLAAHRRRRRDRRARASSASPTARRT